MGSGLFQDLAVGSVAGYAGTKVMDRASTLVYQRQSESSRKREEQLRTQMPTTVLVRKAADYLGKELDDTQAERLGMAVHQATGMMGGTAGVLLARRGLPAVAAGLIAGLGVFAAVDEGVNYVLGLTPPATDWPLVTHRRSLVAHLAYGLGIGAVLALGRLVGAARRPS